MTGIGRVAAWLASSLLMVTLARAAPLDAAQCKTYDAQQKILEGQGLKVDVARGAEWAKADLSASRVELIKHYIYLKEQVAFRCPSLIAVSAPELAEPEARHPIAEAPGKAGKKASGKKRDKKKRKAADGSVPLPAKKATATQ